MKKAWSLLLLLCCGCQTLKHKAEQVRALMHPPESARQIALETKWVRATTTREHLGARRLNRMAPLVFEDAVIIGNGIDSISAYHRKSGNLLWNFAVSGGVEAGAQVLDERLYFGGNDGFFYCIDAKSGKEVWKFAIRFEGLGAPLVKNGRVYFLAGNNVAYALDAKDGKQLWTYSRSEGATFTVRGGSQPALVGETLYMGFSDGALVALNTRDGSLIWERLLSQNQRFKDVDASPVIEGDTIYISNYDGSLYALSRAEGQILWRFDEGSYYTVTVDQECIYYASTARKLISLDKKSGRVMWSEELPKNLATQPALLEGFLILGTVDGALQVRRTQDGALVTQFSPGRGISAPPTATSEGIFFLSNDANLFAMSLTRKDPRAVWPWEEQL